MPKYKILHETLLQAKKPDMQRVLNDFLKKEGLFRISRANTQHMDVFYMNSILDVVPSTGNPEEPKEALKYGKP